MRAMKSASSPICLLRVDAPDLPRHIGKQDAPGPRIVERAPHHDMQPALDHAGAQHLDAAFLARAWRNLQGVVRRGHGILTSRIQR